eukprot:4311645-Prorocentrum_lima.AAC.1
MGRLGQEAVPGIQQHPTVRSHRTHVDQVLTAPHERVDRIKNTSDERVTKEVHLRIRTRSFPRSYNYIYCVVLGAPN